MVIPYAEDAYYRHRPSLAIPAPNDRRRPAKEHAIALNDLFALHPALGVKVIDEKGLPVAPGTLVIVCERKGVDATP